MAYKYSVQEKIFSVYSKLLEHRKKNYYSISVTITLSIITLLIILLTQDSNDKFVTWLAKECIKNEPELKLTKGEQKRDFIYVSDATNAFLFVYFTHFNHYY